MIKAELERENRNLRAKCRDESNKVYDLSNALKDKKEEIADLKIKSDKTEFYKGRCSVFEDLFIFNRTAIKFDKDASIEDHDRRNHRF